MTTPAARRPRATAVDDWNGNGNGNPNAESLPREETESVFFVQYWVFNVDPSWFVVDKCEKKLNDSLDPRNYVKQAR